MAAITNVPPVPQRQLDAASVTRLVQDEATEHGSKQVERHAPAQDDEDRPRRKALPTFKLDTYA